MPLLSLLIFLPLFGAVFILTQRGAEETVAQNARWAALWTSLVVFVLSLALWFGFDPAQDGYQFVEKIAWLPQFGISYHIGVDGISMPFVLLSTALVPVCIAASWNSITSRVREYMVAFLVLETLMVGMFAALDMVLFYVFFEGVLIPMFLIIGIWGGKRRVYAAFKFFLYTLAGSVLMLIALMVIYFKGGATTDLPSLLAMKETIDPVMQHWLFLAFFAAFAVKMPMWPVHTWLPDAHVEAPTAGSIILAGVLLKMGGYGFVRFSMGLLPNASAFFAPMIFGLSVIAVIYTSLVALAQTDIKKLIAYSSVAHMGFVTLGLFTFTEQGVQGALFQMLSHGLISGALFLAVGVIYERMHTREIAAYGGVAHKMPKYALFFMFFTMASVGLPGTSGFVGEFLVIAGTFRVNTATAFFAATGLVLGAAYMLSLYKRMMFGKVSDTVEKHAAEHGLPDLNQRELAMFVPLAVAVLWLGIFPSPVLKRMEKPVASIIANFETRTGRVLPAVEMGKPVALPEVEHKTEHAPEENSENKPEQKEHEE